MTSAADAELAGRLASVLGADGIERTPAAVGRGVAGDVVVRRRRRLGHRRSLILQRQRAGSERDIAVEAAAVRAAGGRWRAGRRGRRRVDRPRGARRAVHDRHRRRRARRSPARSSATTSSPPPASRSPAQLRRGAGRAPRASTRRPSRASRRSDQVAQYREVLDTLGEPHPAFELGVPLARGQPAAAGPRRPSCTATSGSAT